MALAIFLTAACAPAAVSPASVAGDPASPFTGTAFTMGGDPDMVEFFADQGSLIAYSTRSAPPPYASKIQRADPATKTWRTVYESDAMFDLRRVAAGRIAVHEYRETPESGGAFSAKITVVDLASGIPLTIDAFALSAATFRGGGSAPRRPGFGLALGSDRVAWTRLIEGPAGTITGELELAPLTDPTRRETIARSAEWVAPLAVDATRLVYVLGGKTHDELHVRDLGSGRDTIARVTPVGDVAVGVLPGMDNAAVTGKWAVWPENGPPISQGTGPANATIHAFDLTTRAERTLDTGDATACWRVTAGSRYIAPGCMARAGATVPLYDAVTVQPVAVPPGLGVGAIAADDGIIWFSAPPDARTVTLFRPRLLTSTLAR
jgi:hypothetical protein